MAETGSLRTYLGTAPGVGKTFRMLAEGRSRATNGERVVIGWLETHGRAETSRQAEGLGVIEPRPVTYRGSVFREFDPAAAIASGAGVVLVDELAHMSPDRGRQRWEEVADVLAAGLDVAVPPLVLAADSGSASGAAVIQRAAEIAREEDAQLVVAHVRVTDGLTRGRSADLNRHRKLTAELGGTYIQTEGTTLEEALAKTARAQDAAIIVVGRNQSRLAAFFLGSVSARLRRFLPEADVREVPAS